MNEEKTNFVADDAASWDYAQIWDKFPVPARPSREELDFLEKDIKQTPNDNLLILGSTVEYRSMCERLGLIPFVVDFEKRHYDILTSYAKDSIGDENFLEKDWLEIEDEDKYNIIIGHRAINVVGKDILQNFFDKMYKSLKPGGVFYCKGNILYDGQKDKLDELVDKWAFAVGRDYPLFSYIEVDLYFHTADEDGYVIYPKARKIVESLYTDKKCAQEDYDLIRLLVSMSETARFRGLIRESEIKEIISKAGFVDSEWITLDKDICSNMPIIKLRKSV